MRTLRDIRHLENVPVLVRAALNVPVADGTVTNTFRLRSALPTIEYLRSRHARVILIGHLGDKSTESFLPVYEALKGFIPGIKFCDSAVGKAAREAVRDLVPGDVLLLENLRRHAGEKGNDPAFAAELASLADAFVMDSFDVCHRTHASVVGVPELLPSYAGLQVEREVKELSKGLRPRRPALAIIGGAKFATKEALLSVLLDSYDHVFVGGALANDFMQALGQSVGTSLVSGADHAAIEKLLHNQKLRLPIDYVVAPLGSEREEGHLAGVTIVSNTEAILDNGPKTLEMLGALVADAKTILWNGPLGNYEKGFTDGTEALARLIATSKAHSIVGGGDTIAAIEKLGLDEHFSFISTGGGAMLDFLADGSLPGIEALQ
ncbi:MAG TPA: phosphoglycerate kinase [Candidatus Paceibacterota bacterium]|nr:phosphoglycerate kinase [Candidatus Paceibacterota bacterium]